MQLSHSVYPDESIRDGVLRILNSIIHHLAHPQNRSRNCLIDPHDIRTAIKFERALWSLFTPIVGKKVAEQESSKLRDAGRKLSSIRDAKVILETINEIMARTKKRKSKENLIKLKNLISDPPISNSEGFSTRKTHCAAAIDQLSKTRDVFACLDFKKHSPNRIKEVLAQSHNRARKRMKLALKDRSDKAFHRWRIATKTYFYQLGFLKNFLPAKFEKQFKRCDSLQSCLGKQHDLAILSKKVKEIPSLSKKEILRLQTEINSADKRYQTRSEIFGNKVFKRKMNRVQFIQKLTPC